MPIFVRNEILKRVEGLKMIHRALRSIGRSSSSPRRNRIYCLFFVAVTTALLCKPLPAQSDGGGAAQASGQSGSGQSSGQSSGTQTAGQTGNGRAANSSNTTGSAQTSAPNGNARGP